MGAQLTVGEVARLTGVSVRTLHHYDEVGLLAPAGRTPGGYRLYRPDDLARLRQILFYRELEFSLDDIARMLADPGATADDHLRRQYQLLRDRIGRGRDLLAAVEKEMEARQMGISLSREEQFEIFGPNWLGDKYEAEAEQRWGDTEAYRQSQARAAALTRQDWVAVKAESDAIEAAFAQAMRDGVPVDGGDVAALAERHRASVSGFWDCNHVAHRNLAQMYLADDRFRAHYDELAPGLAQYVHDAIVANADRHAAS